MYSDIGLAGAVLLTLIPGVVCKYEYSVGGLVASAFVSFLLLIAVILMLIIAIMWHSWYRRRQAKRGIPRVARREWRLFKEKSKKNEFTAPPRSERKMGYMDSYNAVPAGGSRNTTLTRGRSADAWMTQLPTTDNYEVKTKTLQFDQEEEAVIVADLLPDTNTTRLGSTQYRVSQQPTYAYNPNPTNDYRTTEMRSAHIEMGRETPTLRTTTMQLEPGENEPYHVRLSQVSARSSRPNDFFIAPIVPSSNNQNPGTSNNQNPGTDADVIRSEADVVVFNDSDDEAGHIPNPQPEDMVMF